MPSYGTQGERARVSACTNLSRGPQEGRADSPECRNVGQESSMAADIMLWELASLHGCVCVCAHAPEYTLYTHEHTDYRQMHLHLSYNLNVHVPETKMHKGYWVQYGRFYMCAHT